MSDFLSGSTLYGSFAASGKLDGSSWSQITTNNPVSMVVDSDYELYRAFAGSVIWKRDGSNWAQVTLNNPVSMVTGY